MSLATKYRPKTFEEVCGQQITTKLLKKAIEQNKFSNAILLAGSSGCGKTTLARIFARAVNKNPKYEAIELNASNRFGAEDIENLIESSKSRAINGEYKVFIIDECHMLGGGNKTGNAAWSAMLKCIEECSKYTIFIFCTTDPQRIPDTILNRVQKYNILPIAAEEIKSRLEYICKEECFTNYEKTCELISKTCQGGMRDAISTLEQCADFSTDLSDKDIEQVLNGGDFKTMFNLTWALQQKDESKVLAIFEDLYNAGKDLKQFTAIYLDFILDLQKYVLFNNDITKTNIPAYLATEQNPVVQTTLNYQNGLTYFRKLAELILNLRQIIKWDTAAVKSTIEVVFLQFCRG